MDYSNSFSSSKGRNQSCFGSSWSKDQKSTKWIQVLFNNSLSSPQSEVGRKWTEKDLINKENEEFIRNHSDEGRLQFRYTGPVQTQSLRRHPGFRRKGKRKSSMCTHTLMSTENGSLMVDQNSEKLPPQQSRVSYNKTSLRRVISNPLEEYQTFINKKRPLYRNTLISTENGCLMVDQNSEKLPPRQSRFSYNKTSLRRVISNPLHFRYKGPVQTQPLRRHLGFRRKGRRKSSTCTLISTENGSFMVDQNSERLPPQQSRDSYNKTSLRRVISNPLEYQTFINRKRSPFRNSVSYAPNIE